jgi:hypothetical protein
VHRTNIQTAYHSPFSQTCSSAAQVAPGAAVPAGARLLADARHAPDLPSYAPSRVSAAHPEVQMLADSVT